MKMTKQTELLGGRYQIVRELARGGFGITFIAKDTLSSNSTCVIKKLDPQNADIETAKILFQREAHILNYLQQNQQIPKFLNYFEEGQHFYLVQEYIEGKSLDKLLDKRWTELRVVSFLREILSILQCLHEVNILHRDIKPSNVIRRDKDNKFVLIDFGSVKQLYPYLSSQSGQQELPAHTMIGTPGYAPAEQMAGRPGFNSDIYGLGMTAIQLLAGIHPRNLKRDKQDDVIWIEGVDIDESLATILTKMVYSSPERRYQSVDEVIENLNAIITVQQNHTFTNSSQSVPLTEHSTPTFRTQSNKTRAPSRLLFKLWHIPILLTVLGAIVVGLEFIQPFFRPLYYSYQGNRLLDVRQPEAALEQFENLIEIIPNSAIAWKGRGDALLSIGRYSGALEAYNKAISIQSNDLKSLNNKGKVLYKLRRYKEALDTHEKVLELDSNNAEAWSGKGLAYIGLQQYQKASESFERLRQLRPDEPKIWYEVGLATEQLQGPQAAKEYYEEAIQSYNFFLKKKPSDPIAWSDKGTVLLKLNRPDEALVSYQKALDIDSKFYEALLGKGNALLRIGKEKRQEALLAFNQASKIRPQDYEVWYNRGILLAQYFQDHEEALKSFEKVIQLRYDFSSAWVNKGLALLELKRDNEALVAFNKAKDLDPKNAYAWANRWYILNKLGKTEEARDSYNKAIELGFPPEQLTTVK